MNRLESMLQPGEGVLCCNRPGLGFGVSLLIGLVLAAVLIAGLAWLGGGWQSLWHEPYRLLPLGALVVIGGQRSWDAVLITDRRLLITRGLLRRSVAEIARADILSAAVTASVPYYGDMVTVRCRDTAAVRLYSAGTAGAAAWGRDSIETMLSADAEAMCEALVPPGRPWGDGAAS